MAISRNAPCPCGSGKKYKHCCGSTNARSITAAPTQYAHRQCGECTACCDGWVKLKVYGEEVCPGKPCRFSIDHHCSIYARRPVDPCHQFICGWLRQDSFLPEWFRPDKAGCIVLPAELSWRQLPVDLVIPAGQRIKPKSLVWIKRYAQEQGRLLIYGEGNEIWSCYGPPDFQHEMTRRSNKGERWW